MDGPPHQLETKKNDGLFRSRNGVGNFNPKTSFIFNNGTEYRA